MTSDVEEVWVLGLNGLLQMQVLKMVFRGTVDHCFIHPRDIFRCAIRANCSQLIVAHNHPSGDLQPSQEDIEITQSLICASKVLEIPILDHLILTHAGFTSLAQQGYFNLNQMKTSRREMLDPEDLGATCEPQSLQNSSRP